MGSAFAIQVFTGRESNVKKMLDWMIERNDLAKSWIKEIHTFSQGTQKLLDSGKLGKRVERAALPGYIFIEMNYRQDEYNTSAYIPAELWHLIQNIPGVLRQFTKSGQIIGAESFESLIGRLLGEDSIEVAVEISNNDKEVATTNHAYNVASTPELKREAENKITQLESELTISEQIEDLITKVSVRVQAFIRRQKEVVRFPISLFEQTLNNANENESNKLQKPKDFIPLLLKTLHTEVMLN